ncbi:hypothetical protein ACFLQU_05195 [Verrucomicrobiota bacterium]
MRGRKKKRTDKHEKGGVELAGEALHLLRTAPLGMLVSYYVGSVSFVMGMLYFCSDMSRSAFADQRCSAASLGLALLFLWMKSWQTVFAQGLTASVTGGRWGPWSAARVGRVAAVQTALQPYGLLLIPVSFVLMLPFHRMHAFFQNLTVLGHGETRDVKSLAKDAWKQAGLWPTQNYVTMWLTNTWVLAILMVFAFGACRLGVSNTPEMQNLDHVVWFVISIGIIASFFLPFCPVGWAVAGNVALLLVIAPALSRSLLGMETVFTVGGWHAIFSTTFIATVYGITYLLMDPLVKSIHVLRCFYGGARTTGEDLLVGLRGEGT